MSGGKPPFTSNDFVLWADSDKEMNHNLLNIWCVCVCVSCRVKQPIGGGELWGGLLFQTK